MCANERADDQPRDRDEVPVATRQSREACATPAGQSERPYDEETTGEHQRRVQSGEERDRFAVRWQRDELGDERRCDERQHSLGATAAAATSAMAATTTGTER